MKVHFSNVGRDKKSFTAEIDELCHDKMLKIIRKYVLSRDVEFHTKPPDHNTGTIVVGGFREVGTFRLELPDDEPTLVSWMEGWEAACEAGQSSISRQEAENRWWQQYGRKSDDY